MLDRVHAALAFFGSLRLRGLTAEECAFWPALVIGVALVLYLAHLRAAYSHHDRIIRRAEFGVDLSVGGLAIALITVAEMSCNQELTFVFPAISKQTGQSYYWVAAIPILGMLAFRATLQARVLLDPGNNQSPRPVYRYITSVSSMWAGLLTFVVATAFSAGQIV